MKILAVQNRMGIGDMVIFLPFIEAISKNFRVPVSILVKESSKAIQFLKDNNIDAVPVEDSPLKKLMEELPFDDEKDKQILKN